MHLLFLLLALQQPAEKPAEPGPSAPEPSALTHDLFGVNIDRAGDLDGDGIEDLWVGDPSLSGADDGRHSCVWAVSGSTGKAIRRIAAPRESLGFGATVCSLDDIDGDGVREVAIGCQFLGPGEDYRWRDAIGQTSPPGEGAVFLYSGAEGSLRWVVHGAADEFKIPWYTAAAGPTLCPVGDWNDDGVEDLAVGWSYGNSDVQDCGRVEVVSGADGELLQSWSGSEAYDRLGTVLCAVGDLDGDGRTELAATAWPNRKRGEEGPYSHRHATGYVRVLSSTGGALTTLRPADEGRCFGLSLAVLPDGEDGTRGGLLVGHPFFGDSRASIQLWSPHEGKLLRSFDKPSIEDWSGGQKYPYQPPPEEVDLSFGARLLVVPDRDGDGLADLLVTVPEGFPTVPAGVLSSATEQSLARLHLERNNYVFIGLASCGMADLDGDAFSDFALGGASVPCGDSCYAAVLLVSGKELVPIRTIVGAELRR